MEAIIEASADQLVDLWMPNYDVNMSSFLHQEGTKSSRSRTMNNKNGSSLGNSSSVRYVTNKELPVYHPPNVFGGGSHFLDYDDCHELKDVFTGLIDAITGFLISGTREYILTGEIYEGPFRNNLRHGNGAIVRNIYLPQNSISTGSLSSLPNINTNTYSSTSAARKHDAGIPKFYGTFHNDAPSHGTLVVPSMFTYQGPLQQSRPHGENGTLIKPSGYKYEGSFRYGLFHGMGVEIESSGGIYKGSFANGVREGYGMYTAIVKYTNATRTAVKMIKDIGVGVQYCYKGQWLDNQKQGEGEERLKLREVYRGQFHANERQGYGSLTFEDPAGFSKSDSDSDNDECINNNDTNDTFDTEQSTKHAGDDSLSMESQSTYSEDGKRECERERERDRVHNSPQPITPVVAVAEGVWRAGHPLNGTHEWTLMYGTGNCYAGYASDFRPEGYGVMRYSNQDIYTGEWVKGKRSGEGCFISGDGKEEYVGFWDDDKIVPVDEGDRNERMARLTDMALVLLQDNEYRNDNDNDSIDDVDAEKALGEFIQQGEDVYKSQRKLLESIVEKSLAKSIDRMNQCKGFNDNWSLWTPTSKESSRRGMNTPTITLRKLKVDQDEHPKIIVESTCSGVKKVKNEAEQSDNAVGCDESESPVHVVPARTQLKTYKNGDTYLGSHCVRTGLRRGYGVYVSSATGSTYSGMFESNVKQGYGILLHPLGKYSGHFLNDAKEGEGTLIFNDASSYNGGFKENQFHGKGTLCTKENTVYVGDWYGGLKNGQGCETYADGRIYSGGFQDGQRSGAGALYKNSGGDVIYSGSWLNGIFHGEGTCSYQQVEVQGNMDPSEPSENNKELRYQGSFFNGLRHGYGVLTNDPDGLVLKGQWHKNMPNHGKWRIEYQDGRIYSGGAKVKEGMLPVSESRDKDQSIPIPIPMTTDSSKSEAPLVIDTFEIVMPSPHGFGALRYSNGDVYIGKFQNGTRMGLGALFISGGVKLEGTWKNDKLVLDNTVSTQTEDSDIHSGSYS